LLHKPTTSTHELSESNVQVKIVDAKIAETFGQDRQIRSRMIPNNMCSEPLSKMERPFYEGRCEAVTEHLYSKVVCQCLLVNCSYIKYTVYTDDTLFNILTRAAPVPSPS
jgi:hypothetical protein